MCNQIVMNDDQEEYQLAWQSFKFYNEQLFQKEEDHIKLVEEIKDFFEKNNSPSKKQKQPLKRKYRKSSTTLISLYSKLLQEMNILIQIQKNKSLDLEIKINEDDPLSVDIIMMEELSKVTAVLREEMKIEHDQFLEIFDYEN
jgi:hypothetical protein